MDFKVILNRMENKIEAIKERIDTYMSIKQEDSNERIQKLNRVFREMIPEGLKPKVDPRTYTVL